MNMREARAMVEGLRSTRAQAPDGLADSVLAELGLVDDGSALLRQCGLLGLAQVGGEVKGRIHPSALLRPA